MITKALALKELKARQKKNRTEKQIDNSSLYAGSPMYFYCYSCQGVSDILPEDYRCVPKHLCNLCQELKDNGWI